MKAIFDLTSFQSNTEDEDDFFPSLPFGISVEQAMSDRHMLDVALEDLE